MSDNTQDNNLDDNAVKPNIMRDLCATAAARSGAVEVEALLVAAGVTISNRVHAIVEGAMALVFCAGWDLADGTREEREAMGDDVVVDLYVRRNSTPTGHKVQ